MTVTVWGECGGPDTLAAQYDHYGRVTSAHTYRELELELPAEGIAIDCDHDGVRVGTLLYAELGDDERLRAVCVLDNDGIEQVEQSVFFSPMLEMRGHGIDRSDTYIARAAELIGLSVTFQTARLAASPVSWRQGDLRNSSDRYSKWPSSWQTSDPLLARALDHLGTGTQLRTRSATRILDKRDHGDQPPPPGSYDRMKMRDWRSLPGGMMKSAHVGRILSVR